MSIKELIKFIRSNGFGGSRQRAYAGQPWTFTGVRGKALLPPMTLRDLGDSIVEALANFPDLEKVDLNALAQTICKKIEDQK
jgi:hypothetical protein